MAKKLKIKLPKRVAGVKIPKTVRKGPIADFLNSGAGQLVLAQALVAIAGTLAVSKTRPDSRAGNAIRHPADTARRAAQHLTDMGADQGARLSYALQEAARAFRTAMEEGAPANYTPPTELEASGKKKQRAETDARH